MAVYTAAIDISRYGVFQEQIVLENIHAKTEREAQNKAGQQATKYLAQHSDKDDSPTGFKIALCCRTSLLEKNSTLVPHRVIQHPQLPPPATKVAPATSKVDLSPLDGDCMGDFKDPFSFAKDLLLRVHTYSYSRRF